MRKAAIDKAELPCSLWASHFGTALVPSPVLCSTSQGGWRRRGWACTSEQWLLSFATAMARLWRQSFLSCRISWPAWIYYLSLPRLLPFYTFLIFHPSFRMSVTDHFFFPPLSLHISFAFFIWNGMHFFPTPDYNLPRSDILLSHSFDYLWQLWLHDQKGRNINKGKGKSSGCQQGTAKVMKLKGLPCCSLSSTSTVHSLDSWDTITVCCGCNCSDVSFCGAGQP